MGTFDIGVFWTYLVVGLLIALALGWYLLHRPDWPQNPHYGPVVGALLGFALGCAVGQTDVWYSPDWFPPMNFYLRQMIIGPFVIVGGSLGWFGEMIWRAVFR